MPKRETYAASHRRLLGYLRAQGWTVADRLRVPHATDPWEDTRLYFKAQAVYKDDGKPFKLNNARSLWVETRGLSGPALLRAAGYDGDRNCVCPPKGRRSAGSWPQGRNRSYKQLAAFKPRAYLNWRNFVTDYPLDADPNHPRQGEQYAAGLKTGREAREIHLSIKGVWSARMKNGSSIQSYEGIGYHASTASLLRGFLDSGAPIIVHRADGSATRIKG